jgi:capsular polysaccharide transport system permease protein
MSGGLLQRWPSLRDASFLAAPRRYGQILFALLQREQERRRASPLESIADVLEPLALVVVMAFMWSFLNRRTTSPLGDSSVLFIATGFYAKFYWITLAKLTKATIGTSKRRFPVERRFDYVLVHILLTTGDYLALALVGFGFLYWFYTPTAIPFNWVPIVESMLALIALGFGWGMITVVMTQFFWPWAYFAGLFNRALIFFSGIFFMVEFLPPEPREVMSYNPIMHAIALFRTGFYPNYPTGVLDPTFLFYCSIGAVFIGIVLERITVRFEE